MVSAPGLCCVLPLLLLLLLHFCDSFNLDTEQRVVYSGPPGSYFGYSVEFFGNASSFSVLIGAPKANTSQPHITEGGAIFLCPWSKSNCTIIDFDKHERMGKAAPSVFSGVRTGTETVLEKNSITKTPGASAFSK